MMALAGLNEQQLAQAFRDCHRRLEILLEKPGQTYASLAERIGIGDSALKQFMRRGRLAKHAIVRRGSAFERIFRYLNGLDGNLPSGNEISPNKAIHSSLLDTLSQMDYRQQVLLSYLAVSKILRVQPDENDKAGNKMNGYYLCYRNGSSDKFIVKSLLRISRVESSINLPLWEFVHCHYDSNDVIKKSDGIFISIAKSIYLFGDLAEGEGVDFMILSEPLTSNFSFVSGFEVSIDHNYNPFFAKLFCIKTCQLEESLPKNLYGIPEISEDVLREYTGVILKETVAEKGINGNTSLAQRILSHLRVEETGGLIRPGTRDIVGNILKTP